LTLARAPVYRVSMNIPPRPRTSSRLTLTLAAAVLGLMAQACATSGGSSPPPASGPIELDGTRWKLIALGGNLDGRIVEFHKRGSDGYVGQMVDPGRRLRDVVGLKPGYEMFQLKKKKDNEYEGVYKSVDPSGTQADKEVVVFVSGNQLTWNQESAVWEKQ
jgi:hypothetical protein